MKERLAWLRGQATERTVLGLKLLAVLAALAAYLALRDEVASALATARAVRAEAASMAGLEGEDAWLERAVLARAAAAGWEDATWSAPTAGVAAATAQQVLERLGHEARFATLTTRVDAAPVEVGGQTVLRFEVVGRGDVAAIVGFIAALGLHAPRLIATDVNANFATQAPILRLSGIAPWRQQTHAGEQ